MALTVGELRGVLTLDDSQYNQKIDRSERRFSGLAGALGRGVKTVATVAGAAMIAAGGVGLSTASQMEQAEIGFTTMLGSGVKARAFLGDLSSFAAKTPFEFPELQKAASSLVSVGVESKRVIPIMTVLGDATAAMGTGSEGIRRATMALQQMAIKGKVSGEEMLQLAEAGIPAWDALAASLGVTGAEAQKLVSEGKVSVDQLYKAIETRSGTSLKRVSGMMAVQSQSMAGMWSTLKDTFSVGMANAIKPLIPLIKDGLGAATNAAAASLPRLTIGLQGVVAAGKLLATGDFEGGIFGLDEDSRAVDILFRIREGLLGVWAAGRLVMTGDFRGGIFNQAEGSKTVDVLFRIRDALRGVGDQINGVDREQAKQMFASVLESAQKLLPVVQEFIAELPVFGDVLSVSVKALAFLADHTDLLRKLIPYLIAGVIAYKVAQLAANVAQAASVPAKIAEVVVNRQLVRSNRELIATRAGVIAATVGNTTATTANTAATAANAAASGRSRVAMIVAAVAHKAVAAATVAWTGVQWLLNAALTANPIGIVIVAIAALIAIIVIAYKKSETFRKIVHGAMHGVKASFWAIVHGFAAAWRAVSGSWSRFAGWVAGWPSTITRRVAAMFYAVATAWWNANWAVINAVGRFFGWVGQWPGAVRARVIGMFSAVTSSFGTAWGQVSHGWSRFAGWVAGWPGAIGRRLGSMFNAIPSAFRSAINAVIRAWNNLEFRIPGFDPPGPLGPFGSITIGTPDLPYLQRGGRVRRGGLGVVGEREAEIVDFPTGARVTPLSRLADGLERIILEIDIRSGGSRFDDFLVEVLSKAVRKRGGNVQLVLGGGRTR